MTGRSSAPGEFGSAVKTEPAVPGVAFGFSKPPPTVGPDGGDGLAVEDRGFMLSARAPVAVGGGILPPFPFATCCHPRSPRRPSAFCCWRFWSCACPIAYF